MHPDLSADDVRQLQSFISASNNEQGAHDDSEEREEELSIIGEVRSPPSSDDDQILIHHNNRSVLNSANAERNERILAPGSGASTPRQAQSSVNRSLRSIRSIGDFLVRQGGNVLRSMRRR